MLLSVMKQYWIAYLTDEVDIMVSRIMISSQTRIDKMESDGKKKKKKLRYFQIFSTFVNLL